MRGKENTMSEDTPCDQTYSTCSDSEITEPLFCSSKRTFLPSKDEKIKESVSVGSVFLALESKYFTSKELLNWLSKVAIDEKTKVAYKAVCIAISPNIQYLDDSMHFLTKKPEYIAIAIGYNLNPDIPDSNVAGPINPLYSHLCDALIQLRSDPLQRKMTGLILAGAGSAEYIRSRLVTCFLSRNFPHLRNLSSHDHNVGLVTADWTAKFRYNEQLPNLIIKRVADLQKHAPLYHAGVAYQAYHKVAVKLNKDKLLTSLKRDELAAFNSFFPNIIDQKILGYNDLCYKIALLGNDIAGYILGFPIQSIIPNDDQIHEAISKLSEIGPEKYTSFMKEYVKSTYIPILPFPNCINPTFSNDSDVLMENIDNYVAFDIVAYQTGTHIYRFTRPEFKDLSKSKKNPWTNDWLPQTILTTIKARAEAAKELGLPDPRPLSELLTCLENGKLFVSSEKVCTQSPIPTQIPRNIRPNLEERFTSDQARDPIPATFFGGLMSTSHWYPGLESNDSILPIPTLMTPDGPERTWVPFNNDTSDPVDTERVLGLITRMSEFREMINIDDSSDDDSMPGLEDNFYAPYSSPFIPINAGIPLDDDSDETNEMDLVD